MKQIRTRKFAAILLFCHSAIPPFCYSRCSPRCEQMIRLPFAPCLNRCLIRADRQRFHRATITPDGMEPILLKSSMTVMAYGSRFYVPELLGDQST